MTYVVASLVERGVAGVSRSSSRAFREGADMVEIRLDHLSEGRTDEHLLERVRKAVRGPAIATLRSAAEGGRSRLSRTARNDALMKILAAGFEYVDLELGTDADVLKEVRRGGPRTIASCHFGAPVDRAAAERQLIAACTAGDVGKVAMPCDDALDALMLARLGMKHSGRGERFALIGMGEQGALTRVCAEQIGSALVYSCIAGKPAAPGQLEVSRQKALTGRRRVLTGLIGHPVSHSVSKHMHEAAMERAGITGAYLPMDVPKGMLRRRDLETLSELGFAGVNVTIPHKLKAFEICDDNAGDARATRSVNTVRFSKGAIDGENTDVIGFIRSLEGKISIGKNRSALVIGAGGAARAAVRALSGTGARLTVAARSAPKAREIAEMFHAEGLDLAHATADGRRYDLVVNCTPIGMEGGDPGGRIPETLFREGVVFVDMVYNPPVTRTMRIAEKRGAFAINGLDMLVHQGAASFTLWTGIMPSTSAMLSAAKEALA